MKRTLLAISLCALVLSASAQFKVQSTGTYYVTCNTSGKNGMNMSAVGSTSFTTAYGGMFTSTAPTKSIGLRGSAHNTDLFFGVMGDGDSATKGIGLYGSIYYVNTGAAVYGTVNADLGTALAINEKYAGFFNGNVKSTGSIIAGTTLQGALLGESASSSSSSKGSQSLRGMSIAGSLSDLHVTTYQKERPEQPKDTETIFDLDGDSSKIMETPEPDIMDEQFYGKSHYALDADRLEEVFPDLVYVNKDGSKVINYVEMIPLLVQSINELNEKIEVLEGQSSGRKAAAARGTTGIDNTSTAVNRLYQNTPNPFKETTTIRFTLADDARDAYICIFDMTGKPVKKLPVSAGMDSVSFGGYEIGEGMFLYSLVVNGQEIDTKRMIISK